MISTIDSALCVLLCVFYFCCFKIQIEWLTGGDCIAGMHEVVATKRTVDAITLAQEQNRSLWRVSSTVSEEWMIIFQTRKKKSFIKLTCQSYIDDKFVCACSCLLT